MKTDIVMLVAHFFSDLIIERYNKIRTDLPIDKYDVVILLNMDVLPEGNSNLPLVTYSCEQLERLGYKPICETLLPGSCHFPVLAFFKENQEYSHYWFVEYDVVFNGNWNILMKDYECDRSDFISCYVEKYDYEKNDGWPWWHMKNNVGYPLEQCIKGFNPICRYSHRALQYIDFYQKQRYSAHSEVLITTCLYNAGFTLSDFGGNDEFTPANFKNRHYLKGEGENTGSVRWRPCYNSDETMLIDRLYHPVKQQL